MTAPRPDHLIRHVEAAYLACTRAETQGLGEALRGVSRVQVYLTQLVQPWWDDIATSPATSDPDPIESVRRDVFQQLDSFKLTRDRLGARSTWLWAAAMHAGLSISTQAHWREAQAAWSELSEHSTEYLGEVALPQLHHDPVLRFLRTPMLHASWVTLSQARTVELALTSHVDHPPAATARPLVSREPSARRAQTLMAEWVRPYAALADGEHVSRLEIWNAMDVERNYGWRACQSNGYEVPGQHHLPSTFWETGLAVQVAGIDAIRDELDLCDLTSDPDVRRALRVADNLRDNLSFETLAIEASGTGIGHQGLVV